MEGKGREVLVTIRATVELNKWQLAALLWDGMHERYSEESIKDHVAKGLQLSGVIVKDCIRTAVARWGEDSVQCGPSHEQTEAENAWCSAQVSRVFKF